MSKKKVLFIAPSFMSYENSIIEALSADYDVTYLDSEPILKNVRVRYKKLAVPVKAVLKTFHGLREQTRDSFLNQELEKNTSIQKKINESLKENFDYILAINGDGFPTHVFSELREKNKNSKMILYLWDDYDLLFKTKHIRNFDKVFSFNELDCRKHGYEKLSMFSQPNSVIERDNFEKEFDICMIGSATPERVDFVKKLKAKYDDVYNIFIYLYSKERKFDIETKSIPLSFEEYLDAVSKSRSLFEIVRDKQKGPTTRVNDCKFVKTKIITTNSCKENYVGNGNNILFLDENMTIPEEFIRTDYDNNIEPGVTIDCWTSTLLKG